MDSAHVGILGVSEDEILAPMRVGVDASEFGIEGFYHGINFTGRAFRT